MLSDDAYFDPSVSATAVASSIQASSNRLASLGVCHLCPLIYLSNLLQAKHILIGIEYDLARVPYYSLEANIIPPQNISMAAEYSAALGYELRTFAATNKGSNVAILDA